VDVIVYVETNFLMSVAMGREGRGDDLLAAVSRLYASRFRRAATWSRSRLLKTSRNAEAGAEQNSKSRSPLNPRPRRRLPWGHESPTD
jgi:hypothetical protein